MDKTNSAMTRQDTNPVHEASEPAVSRLPRAGRREWIGLAVLALPALIIGIDLTVLHLTVPMISEDLRPTGSQLLWIMDIYGFVIASLLITMGKLGDRIGRRRLLLIGAGVFGLASVVAAYATSPGMLIGARALLGVAGATLAPSTLSLIRNMFHDSGQRTRAISVWFMATLAGNAIGPLVGGALLERFWWGSAFLLAVPFMVLLLVVGPVLLPEYRNPEPGKVDIASAALSLIAVLAVIYGIQRTAENGPEAVTAIAVVAGLLVGAAFLHRQRKLDDPMLDLSLLGNRAFSVSLATLTLGSLLMTGTGYYGMQFLQLVLGQSTLEAGLWSLPLLLSGIAGAMIVPMVARRLRPGFVVAAGLGIAAIGFALITRVDAVSGLAALIAGFIVIFIGLAPASTLGVALMVGAAPPERAGAAAAMSETSQQLGGALGLAIFGSIGTAVYQASLSHTLPTGLPQSVANAANATLGGAVTAATQVPGQLGAEVLRAAREAFTDGLHVTAAITAVAAAAVALITAVLLRDVRGGSTQEAEPEPADA